MAITVSPGEMLKPALVAFHEMVWPETEKAGLEPVGKYVAALTINSVKMPLGVCVVFERAFVPVTVNCSPKI